MISILEYLNYHDHQCPIFKKLPSLTPSLKGAYARAGRLFGEGELQENLVLNDLKYPNHQRPILKNCPKN